MESIAGSAVVQKRPGGRTAETTCRVNAAVIELLIQDGVQSCTIPAVAARAGVERSTLYRRYSDRWAMIIDVIAAKAEELVSAPNFGSFEKDLSELLRRLAELLDGPLGPAVMMVAAAVKAGATPENADRFWRTRVKQLQPMFDAAIARGELRAGLNPEEAFALAAGPIYFRTFVSRERVDGPFIRRIVASICELYRPQADR